MTMLKKMLCEFIGTCVLVVFACGAAVTATTSQLGALNLTQATLLIAVAFGLGIVAM
ncbi:MAG: aquaporin, partial [Clostridia bacterium]